MGQDDLKVTGYMDLSSAFDLVAPSAQSPEVTEPEIGLRLCLIKRASGSFTQD